MGVTRDYNKARNYYEQSGLPDSFANLGILYQNGFGVDQDFKKAYEYYERAGTPSSRHFLGDIYYCGFGVIKNYNKAYEYYELAGLPASLHMLGWLYQEGLGVNQDYNKAREYYERASITNSFINLGRLYEHGLGVEKNAIKSAIYFIKGKHPNTTSNIISRNISLFKQLCLEPDSYPELLETLASLNDFDSLNLDSSIMIDIRLCCILAQQWLVTRQQKQEITYLRDEHWNPPTTTNPKGGQGYQQCCNHFKETGDILISKK